MAQFQEPEFERQVDVDQFLSATMPRVFDLTLSAKNELNNSHMPEVQKIIGDSLNSLPRHLAYFAEPAMYLLEWFAELPLDIQLPTYWYLRGLDGSAPTEEYQRDFGESYTDKIEKGMESIRSGGASAEVIAAFEELRLERTTSAMSSARDALAGVKYHWPKLPPDVQREVAACAMKIYHFGRARLVEHFRDEFGE